MRKRYTKEFKLEIVSLYESGTAAKQLYTEYNLPRSILYEWINHYKKRIDKNGYVSTYQKDAFESRGEPVGVIFHSDRGKNIQGMNIIPY